jgi:hypothetical protein
MDAEAAAEFERHVRGLYDRMARIAITPRWVRDYDFGAAECRDSCRNWPSKTARIRLSHRPVRPRKSPHHASYGAQASRQHIPGVHQMNTIE